MKHYQHITEWERWQIYWYLRDGKEPWKISKLLWRDPWTISREIKRWTITWWYAPMHAQLQYERRRSNINAERRKITRDSITAITIRKYLIECHRMPWSISWRKKVPVCTQTIYNYIREQEPSLQKYLVRKKWYKKRKSSGKETKVVWYKTIHERPPIVDERIRTWDLEIDTIHSSWSEHKWWLLTITDRVDKFLQWWKLTNRNKQETTSLIINILQSQKEKLFTITSDNGKEFNDYNAIEQALQIPIYYADPYRSSQRGSNEHTNGMVRVFYPKWTDFSTISDEEIQIVFTIINLKPRKSLWYLTPFEAHYWVKLDL